MGKKRFLGILLSLTLMLTMMPVLGLTQEAYATTEYPLWVGGTQVTDDNASDIPATNGTKTGKASYNAETKTLTLDNYSYTGEGYYPQKNASVIYSSENNLTIELTGTNTLTNTTADKTSLGISCSNLTIEGSGVLTANGSNTTSMASTGIQANQITIGPNATVKANGGNAGWESDGIYAKGLIVNGILEAKGDFETKESYGVCLNGYDATNVNVASGGKLTAVGSTKAINGKVKNAIAGRGWSNTAGTDGETAIEINESGRKLDDLKKVQFPVMFAVTFVDGQGKTLKTEELLSGESATAPADPTRDGYTFKGWDKEFSNVTEDMTVTALWEKKADPAPAPTAATVTVNSKTVSAKTLEAAYAKAGVSVDSVATVVLGENVKKISKGSFKNFKNAKTLEVKTRKLTKASVKGSLKGSKVKTVKVKVGKKKTNKKYVKKYKNFFTKKNCGKKVTVKR